MNIKEESKLLQLKAEFQKFYNTKNHESYVNESLELNFTKILNLKTQTQHEISMFFLAGYQACCNIINNKVVFFSK